MIYIFIRFLNGQKKYKIPNKILHTVHNNFKNTFTSFGKTTHFDASEIGEKIHNIHERLETFFVTQLDRDPCRKLSTFLNCT